MVPGAAISLFALGLIFVTADSGRDVIAYIMISLIAFMVFNAGGLQLMGWLTGSETYPLAVRPEGTAVHSATLWGTNLLITLTLLSLINAIGVGPSMWLYALFNVAAWIFVFFRMPDLTGKSLEEIEKNLAEGNSDRQTSHADEYACAARLFGLLCGAVTRQPLTGLEGSVRSGRAARTGFRGRRLSRRLVR